MDINREISKFIKHEILISYTLAVPYSHIPTNNAFIWAVTNNKIQIVKTYNTLYTNLALKIASQKGYDEIVALLLNDPSGRVDPSTHYNYAIKMASRNGHDKVVALLLADPRVDPSANNNWAIRVASGGGHDKVVALLLVDSSGRVDSSMSIHYAIKNAIKNSHDKVVALLLADPRADTSVNDDAIKWAFKFGQIKIVNLLFLPVWTAQSCQSFIN